MRSFPNIAQCVKQCVAGDVVQVSGWVRSVRKHGSVRFVELCDGSTTLPLQVVAESLPEGVRAGAALRLHGRAAALPAAKPGKNGRIPPRHPVEVQLDACTYVGSVGDDYPLQKKYTTPEFLRDVAHLRPRGKTFGAVMRVRSAAAHATHAFFAAEDFLLVHTPVLTSGDCEGGGETFRVAPDAHLTGSASAGPDAFFGGPARLAVSGQLHAEMFACALSRVYAFGPTFRAENSNTPRHLAEFWMLEPEMAFAGLADAAGLAERYTRAVVDAVRARCADELAFFEAHFDAGLSARLEAVAGPTPWPRLRYREAVSALRAEEARRARSGEAAFATPVSYAAGLSSEHERWLAETLCEGVPCVVTHYPAAQKAFYMRRAESDDPEGPVVEAMDVLAPQVAELVGGSAREHDAEILEQRMRADGLLDGSATDMQWYLDLRRHGSVPHAGWGLGFDRLLLLLTAQANVRDVVPVPRAAGQCRY